MSRGNLRVLTRLGLTAGVVQMVTGIIMYLAGVYFAPWSMLVSVLVLLLCIVVAIRFYTTRFRTGKINYLQALTAGVVISLLTGLVYAVYNVLSISFFYPQFLDEIARGRIAQAAARQQSPESFEVVRAGITAVGIAAGNFIRLSVIGSLLSAISALFLKTRRSTSPSAITSA